MQTAAVEPNSILNCGIRFGFDCVFSSSIASRKLIESCPFPLRRETNPAGLAVRVRAVTFPALSEGGLILSHGGYYFSTSGLEIAQMTWVKDSNTIKYFQTSIIEPRIRLKFWIYCAIIIEGAWVLRICNEYQPIVADDPMPCVVKHEKELEPLLYEGRNSVAYILSWSRWWYRDS